MLTQRSIHLVAWIWPFFLLNLGVSARAATLEQKLSAQWSKYKEAQSFALDHIANQNQVVSRSDWEKTLEVPTPLKLTTSDLDQLKKLQIKKIAEAKAKATKNSVIDLNKIRVQKNTEKFCAQLPKGGMLHLHPWGSVDRATLSKILESTNALIKYSDLKATLEGSNPIGSFSLGTFDFLSHYTQLTHYSDLSKTDQQKLQDLFFMPENKNDFKKFTGIFLLLSQLFWSNPAKDPTPLMWEGLFERSKQQNLSYLEISQNIGKNAKWLNSLDTWAADARSRYGIEVKSIGAFNRVMDEAKLRDQARQMLTLPSSNVFVGINLVADETHAPFFEQAQGVYAQVLQASRQKKTHLHMTVHAGELGDVRNLRDSILFGVERIGHGVKLQEDVATLELASRTGLALEANLLSNLRLGVVSNLKDHPYLNFARLGMKVSLSTDDEGIFETTQNSECIAAIEQTDITWFELRQMVQNSIESSFAEQALKTKLSASLETELNQFEKIWK